MDILDIVNSHLKERELLVQNKLQEIVAKLNGGETFEYLAPIYKIEPIFIKEHLEKEGYHFDLESKKWLKEIQQELVKGNISFEQISGVPYTLYSGNSLHFKAEQLSLTTNDLKEILKKYNYKRRWTYIDMGNKSSIPSNVLKIVHLLNAKNYSLQNAAELLKTDVEELKETLREAHFKKVWTLETKVGDLTTETTIEGMTVCRDLDTGILEQIMINEAKYYTNNQVSTILRINPTYYFNLASKQFILEKHFIQVDRGLANKFIQAIPMFRTIDFGRLFSEQGLELFAEISKREVDLKRYRKKENCDQDQQCKAEKKFEVEIEGSKEQNTKGITLEEHNYDPLFKDGMKDKKVKLEKIVEKLNNGLTLYDISKEFAVNRKLRAPFVSNLQFRLENEGYVYDKVTKRWTLTIKEKTKQPLNKKGQNNYLNKDIVDEKNTSTNKDLDLNEVVSFLNNVKSFLKTEVEFGVNRQELKVLLKNNGYNYDGSFKLWTKKNRKALLDEVSDYSEKGVRSFDKLEKSEINSSALTKEIQGYQDEVNEVIETLDHKKNLIKENSKEAKNKISDSEALKLNAKEIQTLRQMISQWQQDKNSEQLGKNNQNVEVTFRLDQQIFKQIDNYSEVSRISKSMVLEKALKQFFENNQRL
ncbi:hypothetical protein ACN6MY_08200 [Peribacillus sp. B-H-3]|uniref:hypothetical protein n=1 Tax=Peribacillus sp. B-H-3 TaxID=3400420 RepID=UPI003B02AFD2